MTQGDDPMFAMMMPARDAQAALALEQESVRESAEYQEAIASIRNTVVGIIQNPEPVRIRRGSVAGLSGAISLSSSC